jgi:hypothetical protein
MGEARRRTKLFDGMATNVEVYRKIAWAGKRCHGCQGSPVIRIKSYTLVDTLRRKYPEQLARMALASDPPGSLNILQTTYGAALLVGDLYACRFCAGAAERAAAKHSSDFFVEIDRGPVLVNPVVQVPQ